MTELLVVLIKIYLILLLLLPVILYFEDPDKNILERLKIDKRGLFICYLSGVVLALLSFCPFLMGLLK